MSHASALRARWQASLACVVTFVLWRWDEGLIAGAFAIGAAVLALLAWCFPRQYEPISRWLDRFAHAFLVTCTWVALGVVYFGLFVPMRLWRAMRGSDPLQLKRDPQRKSYLLPLKPRASRHFERQF